MEHSKAVHAITFLTCFYVISFQISLVCALFCNTALLSLYISCHYCNNGNVHSSAHRILHIYMDIQKGPKFYMDGYDGLCAYTTVKLQHWL